MVRLRPALVAICALALVAAACSATGSQPGETPAGSTSSGALALDAASLDAGQAALGPVGATLGGQRAGDVLAWLSSTPDQPQRGDARIDAYLVHLDGQPIDDAAVTFDTDMTNMSHGQYLVAATSAGKGHYVGQVHFLMPGPWRVITVVERPGQAPLRLRFEFTVTAQ
jgi:hypothetical protein